MLNLVSDQYKTIDHTKFKKFNNKTVLITGANGLIGLNLLAFLVYLKKFYTIDIVCSVNSKPEKYTEALFKDCTVFIGDLTLEQSVSKIENYFADRSFGADIIFHTAGYAQPNRFTKDKISTIKLNTTCTMNLFRLLNKNGTFFYASSSEIYSGLNRCLVKEEEIGTTTPTHPRACYIESKKCGETICLSMMDQYNIKIGRISTTYGPGVKADDTRVISSLINKGLKFGKIDLLDNGESIRTLCYIKNLIEMICEITLNGSDIIYNLTGTTKISIKDIANIISDDLSCEITYGSQPIEGNPAVVSVSIDKYEKEFGKINEENINNGIKNTILWAKFIKELV